MKKVLALVLAVVLCMGLGVVAFADYDNNTSGTDKVKFVVKMEDATLKAEDLKASLTWEDGKEYFKSVELDDSAAKDAVTATATTYVTKAAVVASTDSVTSTYAGQDLTYAADKTTAAAQFAAWKTAFEAANSGWEASFDSTSNKITITAADSNKGNKTLAAADNDSKFTKTAGVDAAPAVAAGIEVTVKFKDYYGVDDLDIDFDVTLKKGSSKKDINSVISGGATKTDAKTVNYVTTFGWGQIPAQSDKDDDTVTVDTDNGLVVFDDEDAKFTTFEFDNVDAISVAGKMSKQGAVNMNLDVAVTDEIKALMKKNEKVDFDVLNFTGKPEFDFTQEVTYSIEDEDVTYYVYEIKDGKAVKVNAKLNDDKDALVWKTRVLGCYIVTDAEIKAADAAAEDGDKTETGDKENPETGASDFVGVAVALGTVSLVAAGAVALKK